MAFFMSVDPMFAFVLATALLCLLFLTGITAGLWYANRKYDRQRNESWKKEQQRLATLPPRIPRIPPANRNVYYADTFGGGGGAEYAVGSPGVSGREGKLVCGEPGQSGKDVMSSAKRTNLRKLNLSVVQTQETSVKGPASDVASSDLIAISLLSESARPSEISAPDKFAGGGGDYGGGGASSSWDSSSSSSDSGSSGGGGD